MRAAAEAATATLAEILRRANGRRRLRVLDLDDVYQVIREAAEDGYGEIAGATVANCYGARAYRTRCSAARRGDGSIKVGIEEGDAHKGTRGGVIRGGTNGPGGATRIKRWADAAPEAGELVLPRRVAAVIIGRYLARVAARQPKLPYPDDLVVTVEDSIRAGNCERQTRKAAAAIGADSAPVLAIRNYLKTHPELTRYAARACAVAAARAKENEHAV